MPEKRFFSTLWSLTRPYWVSEKRAVGFTLLATVVGLALMGVWIEVQFNTWTREMYNTFESKDGAEFWRQLGKFGLLALLYIINAVYRLYYQQMLLIEWRSWLTEKYLADWLKDRTYYRMQLLDRGTDNPDQRIAEDLKLFVDETLTLALGLLSSVVTLVSFTAILWVLSGPLEIAGIEIPGYMFWVALIYAIVASWLVHLIGDPLVELNFNQQRYEADFRFSLIRLRENSEGVALYRGEASESSGFHNRFANVISNWWGLMRKRKQLTWFTSFYAQLAILFPYIVAAPRYFSGKIPLGEFFQIASAFGQVQSALSWFIEAYPLFASWKATVNRLTGFAQAMERVRAQRLEGEREEEPASDLTTSGLELRLPNGATLLPPTTLTLKKNESVLIAGPSGSGKSTLFRALAGIWPYWKGKIGLPNGATVLFLPQRAYLPIGTLKHAVCYPAADESKVSDIAARDALRAVGLDRFADELDRVENWAHVLSGGEQQRLAFARALLNQPDWLFLDEGTASLHDAAERELYELMRTRLPNTTIVSVGHRESLAQFHARRLEWMGSGEGSRLVAVPAAST
jgi:putative ATP-binding cassette transporter